MLVLNKGLRATISLQSYEIEDVVDIALDPNRMKKVAEEAIGDIVDSAKRIAEHSGQF